MCYDGKYGLAADWGRRSNGKGHGQDQDTNAVLADKVCLQKSQALKTSRRVWSMKAYPVQKTIMLGNI